MKFCLPPTQQLTLLPPTYIQVGFPHTECQVFCYSSFTPTLGEGERIFNHPVFGLCWVLLISRSLLDSCSLLWACLNFIGHRRMLKSPCFQPFLIQECVLPILIPIPICLHLSYIYATDLERNTLAPESKVPVKVLAFGSNFTLCQEHTEVTVKQSPMISGNSHVSLWHNPSTVLAHITPSVLMADLQKVSLNTHISLLNSFFAPFIFGRMRNHFYPPFPSPATLDYNYLLSKPVCSATLEVQCGLF